MIIRPAAQSDDLTAIWREVYELYHVPLLPTGVHVPFQPQGEAYVADVESAAIGFCYMDNDWLDELWVRDAWQRRGVGNWMETSMSTHTGGNSAVSSACHM